MIMEVVNLSYTTEVILNVHCLLTLWEVTKTMFSQDLDVHRNILFSLAFSNLR
jgi:hypothetical protein